MPADSKTTIKRYPLAQKLGVNPKKLMAFLVVALGQKVNKGDLIAEKKGPFKKKRFFSPVEGTVLSLSEKGILSLKINSALKKKAVKKLKKKPGLKADRGWGKEASGEICCFEKEVDLIDFQGDFQGRVLVLAGLVSRGLYHKAKSLAAAGIVCGGLPNDGFEREIKQEYLLIDGNRQPLDLPLLVFEKEKKIPEKAWEIFKKNEGKKIFLSGEAGFIWFDEKI